jgi:hypothetical protein
MWKCVDCEVILIGPGLFCEACELQQYINEIQPGLYLTDASHAREYDYLFGIGIRQILQVGAALPPHTDQRFKVRVIPVEDDCDANIGQYFRRAHKFIKRASTVVHCYAGISRHTS